jgi:hypothetical protein
MRIRNCYTDRKCIPIFFKESFVNILTDFSRHDIALGANKTPFLVSIIFAALANYFVSFMFPYKCGLLTNHPNPRPRRCNPFIAMEIHSSIKIIADSAFPGYRVTPFDYYWPLSLVSHAKNNDSLLDYVCLVLEMPDARCRSRCRHWYGFIK